MRPESLRICVTGAEASVSDLARRLDRAAELHEVRLDLLERLDAAVFDLLRVHGARVVATLRPLRQGGRFAGKEDERLATLRRAVDAGAGWIDLELDVFERGDAARVLCPDAPAAWDACVTEWQRTGEAACLERLPGAGGGAVRPRVLLSCHASEGGPCVLEGLAARAARFPADGVKLAVPVAGAADLVALASEWPAGSTAGPQRVVIGLGPAGTITRARPAAFGSDWTYAAAAPDRVTAAGQLPLETLLAWRVREAPSLVPILLVGGAQVAGSPGPDVYNRLFAGAGVPCQYLAVPAASWDEAVAIADVLGAACLSVTMPLKRAAAAAAGEAGDDRVRATGAANTVRIEGGRVVAAANTDAEAAHAILAEAARGGAGTILVLGAGGAAAAFGAAAREVGLRAVVAARDRASVDVACGGLAGAQVVAWEGRSRVEHDVLVNCTPIGADGVASPWPTGVPLAAGTVVDLVNFRGVGTPLVRSARAAGCATMTGADFWAVQGAFQVRWMTGLEATAADLAAELDAIGWLGRPARGPRVVALAGMRGAGKTTVGRCLAARRGWRLVDTDESVERRLGASIADLFRDGREADFRAVETTVTDEALRTDRTVVATGGGCVEDARTRVALGRVFTVLLDVPADVLAARIRGSGRPSLTGASVDAEVATVLARRDGLYRSCTSVVVPAGSGDPDEVCDAIEFAWRALPDHDVR